MNLRTILGLVAALGIAPAITGSATVQGKPAAPPAAESKPRSILEEILATPQTKKKITIFYKFWDDVSTVFDDDLIDEKLFAAALPYVRQFYEGHNILVSFVPSPNLEQGQIDRRTRFGLYYASPRQMTAKMLEETPTSPSDDYFERVLIPLASTKGISFREQGYCIVISDRGMIVRWSQIADKWRLMLTKTGNREQHGGEIPADGEARLFAYLIAHELGHMFGLPHYCGADAGNLMNSYGRHAGAEISVESGSPFSPQRPLGATVDHFQRAMMHSYLGGGAPYHAARHDVDYEAWLTKHGMPVCEEE